MKSRIRTVLIAVACAGLCACGDRSDRDTFNVPLPKWREGAGPVRVTERDNPSDVRKADQVADDTILLATEAERRGLASAYGVQRALRTAIAQITIDDTFRQTTDPAKLMDDELRLAYQRNRWAFNAPPFLSLAHLLFHAKKAKKDPSEMKTAERLCESAVGAAKQAKSAKEFRALQAKFDGKGLDVIFEEFRTWPGKLEKSFEDVAYKMRTPGDVSGCVPSSYGYHIIYLYRHEPAVERSFESVKEEVRAKSAPEFAAYKFNVWMKQLRALYRASLVPDIIARLREEPTR